MTASSNSRLRTAVVQMAPRLADLEANLARHAELVAEARGEGAELIVFPELSLTGYLIGDHGPRLSMRLDDSRLLSLAEAAGDARVVVGLMEEGYAAQFFNSALVLHRGRVVFGHRKLNLATYGELEEGKHFAQGRYIETFELPGGFVGSVLVCADMWNPALVQLATLHGATMMIAPTNSARHAVASEFSNPDGWETVLRFYAMIYGLPIAFANRVGEEDGLSFWGGSRIVDARGNTLVEAGASEEGVYVAELDYEDVKAARWTLPTVRDSNLGLIRREIERLDSRVNIPIRFRDR